MTTAAQDIPWMQAALELARQGFSIDFIAEKVDLPLGEIALILSIGG